MRAIQSPNVQLSRVSSYPLATFPTRKGHDKCRIRAKAMAPVIDLGAVRLSRMADRTYSQSDLHEMAAGLRRLLASIEADEVTANSGTVARLEGAVAALEALASGGDFEGLVP
jgi:hypothetical protein